MIKTVIIEDELRSREFLKNLLVEFCTDLQLVGMAANVEDAVMIINREKPAIIFLDIEMQTGTGFDVLQKMEKYDCDVIFTTAYDHYAIRAIKFSAVDYLLKPIDVEELKEAVDKIRNKKTNGMNSALEVLLTNIKNAKTENPTITLATSEGLEFIPVKDIIRLEAGGAYTTFFLTSGRKLLVSKNLKEFEMLLGDHSFFRVHNSHVINMREVKKFIRTDGGYVVMTDNSQVLVSPKKRDEFLRLMQESGV